jgi:hypothetical protein
MANPSKIPSPQDKPESRTTPSGQFGSEVKQKAQETASGLADKARDFGSAASETARETASSVAGMAQDAGHRAEEAISGMGGRMQSFASTLRQKAPHVGYLGTAASGMADTLESGGRYLQEHDLTAMRDDVAGLIRRYPFQALLVGFGIGFLAARTFRS